MERLRRKLESLRAADNKPAPAGDGTNLTRMPRRPRRMTEEVGGPPDQPWRHDGGSRYDPAPTRPVTRSELQRETGWWPADPGATPQSGPEAAPEPGGSVIDFGAARARRVGGEAPAAGIRRVARPRRINSDTVESPGVGSDEQPDSPR
ncbi:hypothetical protein VMT65_37685 [Nocardia sp. CDC153]|uniref:hypothetical protein n=1 Tax=Nocardia sp. CDC153 TaxID=3112167 RepID=UPI002DBEA8A2|nr:hypothetical protein [Nocardia sp. CDC153]MEC3958818.1 hypothetical protein [Nocardia sp. CDC153]